MTQPDAPTPFAQRPDGGRGNHPLPSYIEGLRTRLEQRLDSDLAGSHVHAGQLTIELPAASALASMRVLRDEFGFAQLVDLCGVDYLHYGHSDWQTSETASGEGFSRGAQPVAEKAGSVFDFSSSAPATAGDGAMVADDRRYAVVYHLLSHAHNQRLRVRVFAAGEPPRVESVVALWAGADWYEREAFDLFGILFEGHPDLRRLLTDYGFIGHPFRKDFPLSGEVEVRYDAEQRRVVYEPVSIEPRTLVPRVIRDSGTQAAPEQDTEAGEG